MAAQMHSAHAPGFVQMRIGPFQSFAPLPQQALSTGVGIRYGDNNLQGFEVVKRCLHWLR